MAYRSLYRKWRPQTFDDVVGQKHIVRTLTNALTQDRIAHAYLFCGPRGTGKTTVARLLAKGVNCAEGPTAEPCDACASCRRIREGYSVDVIEVDGASNRGIDEVREIRENVKFAPTEGRYKVYIVDEVHMLTNEAFNALLKVLEEPPAHVIFIFATTEPHKIPATILSRCQRYDFHRFALPEIAGRLRQVCDQEEFAVSDDALALIARHAEGGMRDALGILDQCVAFADDVDSEVVTDVLGIVPRARLLQFGEFVAAKNVTEGFLFIKELQDDGKEMRQFIRDLTNHFRDLMVIKSVDDPAPFLAAPAEERQGYVAQAARFALEDIIHIIDILGRAERDIRFASQSRLPVEIAFVEMATGSTQEAGRSPASLEIQAGPDVAARLEQLESRMAKLGEMLDQLQTGTTSTLGPVKTPSAPPTTSPAGKAEAGPVSDGQGVETGADGGAETEAPTDESRSSRQVASGEGPLRDQQTGPSGASLAKVQEIWPQILQALKDERMVQAEAYLREGSPISVEGHVITVMFSPAHTFHRANAEQPRVKKPAEKLLSRMLKMDIEMKMEIGHADKEATAGDDGNPESSFSPESDGEEPVQVPSSSTTEERRSGPSNDDEGGAEDPRGADGGLGGQPGKQGSGSQRKATQQGSGTDDVDFDEPILRAALKLFGGKVVKVEELAEES